MAIVIGMMLLGGVVGYLLRGRRMGGLSRWINGAIYLLLFLLGLSVGADDGVMGALGRVGREALLLTAGAVAGSVACAWFVYRYFFR